MPNWCSNNLTVTNLKPEEWETLCESFKEEEFPATFLPEPDWSTLPDNKGKLPRRADGIGRWDDGTQDMRWYHWRNENWGTKWKVGGVEISDTKESDTLEVSFTTAWSPINESCLRKLSKLFPAARFVLTYDEAGMDFYGATVAEGGVSSDASGSVSELRERWEADNEETINKLRTEYDNEDDFEDAVNDLWYDEASDVCQKYKDVYVAMLMQSLERKEVMNERIRTAVERLKEVGGERERDRPTE